MRFFQPIVWWSDGTFVGVALRQSVWLFPIVEAVHLLALTFLLASITVVSLRLFGLVLQRQTVSQVARDLKAWTISSLCVALVSGWCLFASEAFKCNDSTSFRVKMVCLSLAIVYQFTIYAKVTSLGESQLTPRAGKIAATLCLVLWFSVGLAGRGIGFL